MVQQVRMEEQSTGRQVNGIFSACGGRPFSITASGASLNAPGNILTVRRKFATVKV